MPKRRVTGVNPIDGGNRKSKPPVLGGIQIEGSVHVNVPPDVCYRHWREFENLPRFMSHVESVEVLDDIHSHWVVTAPGDTTAEWDAEIIDDSPDERISWRSLDGAQVDNAGSVQFSPRAGGRETEVKVALTYNPPLGALGEAIAKLFGESPSEQLIDDLADFKTVLEEEA